MSNFEDDLIKKLNSKALVDEAKEKGIANSGSSFSIDSNGSEQDHTETREENGTPKDEKSIKDAPMDEESALSLAEAVRRSEMIDKEKIAAITRRFSYGEERNSFADNYPALSKRVYYELFDLQQKLTGEEPDSVTIKRKKREIPTMEDLYALKLQKIAEKIKEIEEQMEKGYERIRIFEESGNTAAVKAEEQRMIEIIDQHRKLIEEQYDVEELRDEEVFKRSKREFEEIKKNSINNETDTKSE